MKQKEIDARGLACPQPVLLAKKAVEEAGGCTIYVDNAAARENVSRMARTLGCDVTVEETDGGTRIRITRKGGGPPVPGTCPVPAGGPAVLVVSTAAMGKGNDELGRILMRSFFHTVNEAIARPDTLILFNEGVTLAVEGSPVLEDLRALEGKGTRILVCGTCLDFFRIKDKLAAGTVSNMYDISETLFSAGRLVQL